MGAGLFFVSLVVEKALKVTDRSGINMVAIVVISYHLTFGFTNVRDLLSLGTGYSEADRYVYEQNSGKYFTTNAPVAWFMNGLGRANFPPHTLPDMDQISKKENVSYLLVDYIFNRLPYPSVTYLRTQCTPDTTIPNPLAQTMPVLLETYLNFEYSEKLKQDPNTGKILVFKLLDCP
jgi:hypothetical protein